MAPGNIRLTYFDGRGRAEQIRWILVQGGAKWEDRRVQQSAWPELKPKTPTGALPFIEVDGKEIGTSGAVAMYAAREFGLLGANNLEAGKITMMWECTQDAFNAKTKAMFCQDPEQQKKLFDDFYTKELPKLFKLMACQLQAGREWLVGDKVSAADLVTVALVEADTDGPGLKAVNDEPLVAALVARVKALPKISKWISTRPETEF